MANESTRLSTADLRRRLTTAPSAPLIFPDDPSVPTALPIHQRSGSSARPSISAELLAQGFVDSSDEFETSAELEDEFGSSQPTPLPPAQASSRKLKRPALQAPAALRPPVTMADTDDFAGLDDGEEMLRLRDENKRYGDMLEEMRQLLLEASDQQERFQTELNTVTAENTAAKARIEELEAIVNTKPKTRSELEEWADELEREASQLNQEKKSLNEDRRQLQEDEMSLEQQMRQMEVGMARERAMLARQETELKRLSSEVQREIESIQRGDAGLRDRMAAFQRRHNEAMGMGGGGGYPASGGSHAGFGPALPVSPTPPPETHTKKNDTTGLLRKLFRSGE